MSENSFDKSEKGFAQLEAALANVEFPELKLDRDSLMYRAGYEAALKAVGMETDSRTVDAKDSASATSGCLEQNSRCDLQRTSVPQDGWKVATILLAGLAAVFAVMAFSNPLALDGTGTASRSEKVDGGVVASAKGEPEAATMDSIASENSRNLDVVPGRDETEADNVFDRGWIDPLRLVQRPVKTFSSSLLRNPDGLVLNRIDYRTPLGDDEWSSRPTSNLELMRQLEDSQ